MKKIIYTLLALLTFTTVNAQDSKSDIPSIEIQDLNFAHFNTGEIDNDGAPIIISFWATWCSPCKRELNTIAEVYDEWQEETGVKLVAISIDDSRNVNKVAPYVNGQAWDYEVYLDPNSDFRRAMNVNNVPHTFLIDGEGHIVYQHNAYSPGDEEKLYELVQKLANGEAVSE
ncbi:MAG: alkyl hydroperoxide reductase [Crocinitomicaceae bacterium]|nr:alkyl hydroperoxide reductase [Crocinitomicaceae bacterium]